MLSFHSNDSMIFENIFIFIIIFYFFSSVRHFSIQFHRTFYIFGFFSGFCLPTYACVRRIVVLVFFFFSFFDSFRSKLFFFFSFILKIILIRRFKCLASSRIASSETIFFFLFHLHRKKIYKRHTESLSIGHLVILAEFFSSSFSTSFSYSFFFLHQNCFLLPAKSKKQN